MSVKKCITQKDISRIEKNKRKFVPSKSKKNTHYLEGNPDYLAHIIDNDVLTRCRGKFAHSGDIEILDLFDPNLDPLKGVYYYEWTEQTQKNFFFGRIMHHLRFLRSADWTKEPGDKSGFTAAEVIEWLCSVEFDEICSLSNLQVRMKCQSNGGYEDPDEFKDDVYETAIFSSLDPNIIRCAIPRIGRKYNREIAGTCKKLLDGLVNFSDWYFEQPVNNAKQLPAWCL